MILITRTEGGFLFSRFLFEQAHTNHKSKYIMTILEIILSVTTAIFFFSTIRLAKVVHRHKKYNDYLFIQSMELIEERDKLNKQIHGHNQK